MSVATQTENQNQPYHISDLERYNTANQLVQNANAFMHAMDALIPNEPSMLQRPVTQEEDKNSLLLREQITHKVEKLSNTMQYVDSDQLEHAIQDINNHRYAIASMEMKAAEPATQDTVLNVAFAARAFKEGFSRYMLASRDEALSEIPIRALPEGMESTIGQTIMYLNGNTNETEEGYVSRETLLKPLTSMSREESQGSYDLGVNALFQEMAVAVADYRGYDLASKLQLKSDRTETLDPTFWPSLQNGYPYLDSKTLQTTQDHKSALRLQESLHIISEQMPAFNEKSQYTRE